MKLEDKFKLNLQFPVRLSLVKHSIHLNLEYAKQLLEKNEFKSVRLLLRLAREDIEDLEYYFKHKSLKEQHIEFR